MARKGGVGVRGKKSVDAMTEVERARRMFELRLKGVTLATIASMFGVSTPRVHQILEKYTKKELLPYVEDYRTMQIERLNVLWNKLVESGRLEKGEPAAINAGVNILRRYAETTGSDAPSKIELGLKIDPKEIELRELIVEAQRRAREDVRAIRGSVEPADEEENDIDEEGDD